MSYQTKDVDYVNFNGSEADKIILNGTVTFRSHRIMDNLSASRWYLNDIEVRMQYSGFKLVNSNPFPIVFTWYIAGEVTYHSCQVAANSTSNFTVQSVGTSSLSDVIPTKSCAIYGTACFVGEINPDSIDRTAFTNFMNAQGATEIDYYHTYGNSSTSVAFHNYWYTRPILSSGDSAEVTTTGDGGDVGTYTWSCSAYNSSKHAVYIYADVTPYALTYYGTLAASSSTTIYLYNNADSNGTMYVRFITTDMTYGNVSTLASISVG